MADEQKPTQREWGWVCARCGLVLRALSHGLAVVSAGRPACDAQMRPLQEAP